MKVGLEKMALVVTGATTRAGFVDGSADLWDRLFAINARSPHLLMKEAIADMLERESCGSIMNIQSVNALWGP